MVTRDGEAVPLDKGLDQSDTRLEMAVRLFDHQQISIGAAAHMAGLPLSGMIDELGRRHIPLIRTTAAALARELAAFDE